MVIHMKNSYCSKCVVELSHTETVCPLCGTRTVSECEDAYGAYPTNSEAVPLSRKHTALKGLIVLLFPAFFCFAIDILVDGIISWGPYIWGAEACFFMFVFLPKLFKKPKTSICLFADTVVTVAYLFLIGHLAGSTEWVLPLGLPLTALAGLLMFSVFKTIKMKKSSYLLKSATLICTVGIYAFATEVVIGIFKYGVFTLGWGLPVMLPLIIISAVLFYIESDSALKDRFVRAVFL